MKPIRNAVTRIAAAALASSILAAPAIATDLRRARVKRRGAGLLSIALLAAAMHSGPAYAAENDAVRVWNERAVTTLTNGTTAGTPGVQFAPPVAFIHLAIVQGAVYDAVNAIKGGYDAYLPRTEGPDQRVEGRGRRDSGASCPDRRRQSGAVDGDADRRRQDRDQGSPRCGIRQLAGRNSGRSGKGQGDRSRSRGCGGDAGQSGR